MEKFLRDSFNMLGIALDDSMTWQFLKYMELLLEWNEKFNLTAITERKDIIIKHFVDSASVLNVCNLSCEKIVDVGTGAGFPGIPMKIVRPDIELFLIDSLNKRVNFLKETVNTLKLDNVTCVHARAEELGVDKDFRESFDCCVSRAVAPLNVLCEYCMPLVKTGGFFAALKGPDVEEEVSKAKNAIDILGGTVRGITAVSLPFSDINHNIIFVEKLRQIPAKYPRKSGKINKSPIN